MKTRIQAVINDKIFFGWQSLSVTRTLGELCSDFSFEAIDFPADEIKRIRAHDPIEIKLLSDHHSWPLLKGYIDIISRSVSGQGRIFRFSGRDKTCDLVDCSAVYGKNTWYHQRLSKIVTDLCADYPIRVDNLNADDPEVTRFTIKTGETVFEAIDRLCSAFAVLPISTTTGDLQLSYAGSSSADVQLEAGSNIKSAEFVIDWSGVYSDYQAKGQGGADGGAWLPKKVHLTGRCLDLGVLRHRPLIFLTERRESQSSIQRRVNWEAQVRSGRAEGATATVLGWLQEDKESSRPWAVNEVVNIVDKKFGIDAQLLVSSVNFTVDQNQGKITNLELSPPEMFSVNPGESVELARRHSVQPY